MCAGKGNKEHYMAISRRDALLGSAGALGRLVYAGDKSAFARLSLHQKFPFPA
jgi:hypothetical protein